MAVVTSCENTLFRGYPKTSTGSWTGLWILEKNRLLRNHHPETEYWGRSPFIPAGRIPLFEAWNELNLGHHNPI